MSTTKADLDRRQQAETAARLMKEYADKLNALAMRLFNIPMRYATGVGNILEIELTAILDGYDAIAPTLETLTRSASQMVEHFDLDKWTELELKLRLRETEQALDAVQSAAEALKNMFPGYFPKARKK
jgi:hypothetical protein